MIVREEYEVIDIPVGQLLRNDGHLQLDPEIERSDYFSVSMRRGTLTMRTGGYVGYMPLTDNVVIYVKPRVPVANLNRMAEVAGTPRIALSWLREYVLGDTWSESYINLYARALAMHIEAIVVNGLLRDYRREEEKSSFPRGRVLMGPTVQSFAARGQNHRAVTTWFARTADIPANRCLKYVMWLLGRYYANRPSQDRESRSIQRLLNAQYSTFDGVSLDESRRFLNDPLVNGYRTLPTHRSYYREALDVASALIRQRGLLLDGEGSGQIRLPSLLLNMSDLFESYIRTVLQQYATDNHWAWEVLDGNAEGSRPLYKGQTSIYATPDIVLRQAASGVTLVAEVKYIPLRGGGGALRDAVNQAVTYAACYETNRVILIHPCGAGQSSSMSKVGDVGKIAVYRYLYNLADDLNNEIERFGSAIGAMLLDLGYVRY